MTGAHLELFIGTEHDRWMPDLEGDLRVPSQSLNPMTSSTGAASAITARRESAVRCLGRDAARPHRRRLDYGAELCSAATILEIGGRHDWWTLLVPFQEVFVA